MHARGQKAIDERRARLELARKILRTKPKTEYPKAVALLSFNLGVTERKAKEYIGMLQLVDGIEVRNGFVLRK